MIEILKETIMFLIWSRFLQILVCNQENQKHIRGLIGLLAVCMILTPVHNKSTGKINYFIEEQMELQESKNDKITHDFWENCREMIDEEMNGTKWREHIEEVTDEKKGVALTEKSKNHKIKVRVLLK